MIFTMQTYKELNYYVLVFYSGPRHVIEEDSVRIDENESLAHYISNHCKFDKENHHIDLPEKHNEEEQNFVCDFYREARERKFEATFNEECFTFIVSDQKLWRSDSMDKREEEKVGTYSNFVFKLF